MLNVLGQKDRGIDIWYPAVLVELGNMRNEQDAARMTTGGGRDMYAQAVTNGVVAFLEQTGRRDVPPS